MTRLPTMVAGLQRVIFQVTAFRKLRFFTKMSHTLRNGG